MLSHGTGASNRRSAPRLKSTPNSKQHNFAFNQPTTKKTAQVKLNRISSQFHKKFNASNGTLNATSEILQAVNEEIGWKPLVLLFICVMFILCVIVFLFLPSTTDDDSVINLHTQHDISHPSHIENIHDINSHLNADSKFETGLGVDPEGYYNSFPHHSNDDDIHAEETDIQENRNKEITNEMKARDHKNKLNKKKRVKRRHTQPRDAKELRDERRTHHRGGQRKRLHEQNERYTELKKDERRRRIIDHHDEGKRKNRGMIDDEIDTNFDDTNDEPYRKRKRNRMKRMDPQFTEENELISKEQMEKEMNDLVRKAKNEKQNPPPIIIADDHQQKVLEEKTNIDENEKPEIIPNVDKNVKSVIVDKKELFEEYENKYRVGLEWKEKKKFQEHWKIIQNVDLTPTLPLENEEEEQKKAYAVKHAFLHAWHGYAKYAMGHDEIHPDSHLPGDSWGGLGATLIDALDTMMIMGIKEEYKDARRILDDINFNVDLRVSFFETTIRHLAGLIGAYEMSGVLGRRDRVIKKKMVELADRLLPAFNTAKGMPKSMVNLQTKEIKNYDWTRGRSVLSEVGSNQLEMYAMSHYTQNSKYFEKSFKIYELLENARGTSILYPRLIDTDSAQFARKEKVFSFGGMSDSFYEYLLKSWILTGYEDERAIRMYVDAIDQANEELLFKVVDERRRPEPYWFYGEQWYGKFRGNMEELTCFVPGLLALGVFHADIRLKQSKMENGVPLTKAEMKLIEMREQHMKLAHVLVETCYQMYAEMATGLAAESVTFTEDEWNPKELRYQLRPETLESLFIMYSVTGNQQYRDWGWKIFESIEKHCKTDVAYSGIIDVSKIPVKQNNEMESYVMAETFKYLFLMYDSYAQEMLPLSVYVFNTEAHPIRIFDMESERWYEHMMERYDEYGDKEYDYDEQDIDRDQDSI